MTRNKMEKALEDGIKIRERLTINVMIVRQFLADHHAHRDVARAMLEIAQLAKMGVEAISLGDLIEGMRETVAKDGG